jgi:hypothetical protein
MQISSMITLSKKNSVMQFTLNLGLKLKEDIFTLLQTRLDGNREGVGQMVEPINTER